VLRISRSAATRVKLGGAMDDLAKTVKLDHQAGFRQTGGPIRAAAFWRLLDVPIQV
jgi:hypothetical protein